MKFDQDIVAAAKRIQELRKEGELHGVRVIELHCRDGRIRVVQAKEERNVRSELKSVT